MTNVFMDTGAFLALFSDDDRYHDRAEAIFSDLRAHSARLVTTNLVVAETVNLLVRQKAPGHRLAVQFGSQICRNWTPMPAHEASQGVPAGTRLLLVYSTSDIERSAWEILERYDTAGFSFTDCVSFAVMQVLGVTEAFAFDSHFDVAGFGRL